MTIETIDPELDRIARASLHELGDIRIDDVLLFIDRGIENMPSYMDLYRRWEHQQWAVADLDFGPDRDLWEQASDLDREATLWTRRLFFNGEERVTATLAPFVWAAPTRDIEIFSPRRWWTKHATPSSSSSGGAPWWAVTGPTWMVSWRSCGPK